MGTGLSGPTQMAVERSFGQKLIIIPRKQLITWARVSPQIFPMLKIGQFQIDKTALLSRNDQSDIMHAHSKQNKYAAKVVLKGLGQQAVDKFRYEAKMLKSAQTPYVARFVNYMETEKYAVLVMELAGKSLKSLESRSGPEVDEVRSIFKEVLLALHELHRLRIVHRNIEPGNMMISTNRKLKLIDFQNAVYFDSVIDPSYINIKQITGYEAPEILSRMHHDEKVDIWSAGVLFHWMLFGEIPFDIQDNSTPTDLLKSISASCAGGFKLHDRLFSRHYKNISRTIESFLRQMLHPDPFKRSSTQQLLCHPIFQEKFKMKLFVYDRGTPRKLESNLSNICSFALSQTQLSTKISSLMSDGDHKLDYQKYLLYRFPASCLDCLKMYDNDVHKKQMKLFRSYLLCVSLVYCQSMFDAIKGEKRDSSDVYFMTVESDYHSMKSELQMELHQFYDMYPYQPNNNLLDCKTFDSVKYKYRALCQQLAKSCVETYNQSRRKFEERTLHLKMALRITLLSIINRVFTHQKCKKLSLMKDYWNVQGEQTTRLESFSAFLDGVGYEKSLQYIQEIMKMFD